MVIWYAIAAANIKKEMMSRDAMIQFNRGPSSSVIMSHIKVVLDIFTVYN